jgi:Endosomal/lysosomal potassium channel TMEM175
MSKGRLEAFSDGVFAVIITIMVLNMNVPRGTDLQALKSVLPVFLCYVLSYIYVGIYWNNHHHLLQASEHVSGGILWANLVLLFCLSLAPFTTAWMRKSLRTTSRRPLRNDAALCRNRIFHSHEELNCAPWQKLGFGKVDWERLERNTQCAGLSTCDPFGLREALDSLRLLCVRGGDVVIPRPPD